MTKIKFDKIDSLSQYYQILFHREHIFILFFVVVLSTPNLKKHFTNVSLKLTSRIGKQVKKQFTLAIFLILLVKAIFFEFF